MKNDRHTSRENESETAASSLMVCGVICGSISHETRRHVRTQVGQSPSAVYGPWRKPIQADWCCNRVARRHGWLEPFTKEADASR